MEIVREDRRRPTTPTQRERRRGRKLRGRRRPKKLYENFPNF